MTNHPNVAIGRAAMAGAAPGIPDLIDASLGPVAPNTVRRIYEQIWGDVYQDTTLGLRDRTLISIAATVEHVATIAGFPRSQTALNTVRDVSTQRNVVV